MLERVGFGHFVFVFVLPISTLRRPAAGRKYLRRLSQIRRRLCSCYNGVMEEQPERRGRRIPIPGKPLIWIIAAVAAVVVVGAVWWLLGRSSSPLPAAILKDATFPIYYPFDSPDGFTANAASAKYDTGGQVFILPLKNINTHEVTLTEQAMPSTLHFQDLVGQGKVLDGINGRAVISNVEGRNVGTMISPDNKTLIILNSLNASNDELTHIFKSLRPVR